MSPKLTILFVPIDAVGHFNACIGIAQPLRDRGHNVVFAVPDNWKNKLAAQGFKEEWLNPENSKDETTKDDGNKLEVWQEIVSHMAPAFLHTPVQQIKSMLAVFFAELVNQIKMSHSRLVEIVKKIKPDIIIVDSIVHQPAVMNCGVPWILSCSITPAAISSKNVPPAFTGYPTHGYEDKKKWEIYREEYKTIFGPIHAEINEWLKGNGGPELKFYDNPLYIKFSPYANIYMYPEELDYTEFRPNPPNFHRFDTFVRSTKEIFEIPAKLKNKPGKLVYLSMGTIGCSELGLMKRLVGILAKSPNRFIVSTGPLANKYELADNMWGEPYLPQTAILPIVDLVISHGGNNTITETFNFGKPLLVLPLFGDQPDNAQRVMEAGLGIRLHAYTSNENEILDAVENLLANDKLADRMKKISKIIQASNSQSRVADLVESIAKNNKIIT